MKKRITALLLCCVMLLTLCPGLISTATAYDDTQPDQAEATGEIVQPTVNFTDVAPFLPPVSGGVPMLRTASFAAPRAAANYAANDTAPDNGMKISKTATPNADGSYTIMLEAYATGSKVITEQKKDIPTDIILVLDQSGSMADDIGTVTYKKYEDVEGYWETTYHTRNQDYYECRHNGGDANLWYKLSDDSYVSVSVTKQEKIEYNQITNGKNDQSGWNNEYTNLWDNRDILYALVGGEYVKVSVDQVGRYSYTYTYTLPDGTVIASGGSWNEKPAISGTDDNKLYLASVDSTQTVYTYTYTDKDGNVQTIGTSTGAETVFDKTLYRRNVNTSGGESRLDALKTAATNFANQVALKAKGKDGIVGTGDDVKHRIAVVGYAGSSSNLTNGFKQMINTSQAADVSSAINNLSADGGTHINEGLSTANGIFASNPLEATENRNRVIIVFTDGAPGLYGDWGSESVQTANNAITYANTAKKPTSKGGYGATVYTIGIFSGADASNPNSLPTYTSYESTIFGEDVPSDADQVKNSNRFMHLVSSNYPDASSITEPGSINPNLNGKSYYLSAADSVALNNIFQQISDQIETGGSSSTLTAASVVKDIISPQFTLPAGATADNITLETYQCTGKNGDVYTWSKNENAMGAEASIGSTDESNATTKNNQVSVTGFNFSENWVGTETNADGSTTYHGNKLVIKFTVKPRDGFLGGNSVITNTNAGIYENATAENPVLTFEQPKVDVTIGNISVSNVESNVYLGGYYSVSVPAEQIKTQMTATCGGVTLDLTQENFGLEEWQYEYVDIAVTVKDADGNDLTGGIESLTEDVAYTVTITVTPKTTGGSATEKTGSGTDTIHVFKPELTFKDGEVYYGDSVPTAFGGNLTNTRWVHYNANGAIDKVAGAEGVSMLNSQPTLTLTYTPGTGIVDGIINTTNDIPVAVTAKIDSTDVTDHTTFVHTKCADDNTCTDPANGKFWLHVNTCTLTVQKSGWDEKDANQSFIFNVAGGEIAQNIKVTVQKNGSATIVGLPVGSYTVTEDSKWSWRYTANGNGSATLSAASHDATVTITNERTATKWLSGDNYAVNHEGGIKPRGTFSGAI